MEIDFVVLWVDGNDPLWLEKINKFRGKEEAHSSSPKRFRDWDTIRYFFRGIETNAPWFRKVHLVVDDQVPKWLNLSHPKLSVVNHRDFIDNKFLPTFSSRVIHCSLPRIPDLSEQFILSDDDMIIVKKTRPTDFFVNEKPAENFRLSRGYSTSGSAAAWYTYLEYNFSLFRREFSQMALTKLLPGFSNFENARRTIRNMFYLSTRKREEIRILLEHGMVSFNKSEVESVFNQIPGQVSATLPMRFRTTQDVGQQAVRFYRIFKNNYHYRSNDFTKYVVVEGSEDFTKLYQEINTNSKLGIICLNDNIDEKDLEEENSFIKMRDELHSFLNRLLPSTSTFEL